MQGRTLEAHHRYSRVLYELLYEKFAVIILPVLEARKSADAQDIEILAQNRGGILDVFHRGAAHDGAFLEFQGPALLVPR